MMKKAGVEVKERIQSINVRDQRDGDSPEQEGEAVC
jgi:hypothetical protein